MPNFLPYNPDQAYLLPPSVKDVLGENHLCFFVHRAVERLEMGRFREGYGEEGRAAYAPELMLKVWLYAYALGVTSSRRLEQRVREDLAFRYLAAGAVPDHWTLNEFRKRHGRAINDVFTQVVELARSLGMGKLGHVAIDSTRVAANASRDRIDQVEGLRRERARIRRKIRAWQKQCDQAGDEEPGMAVGKEAIQRLEQQWAKLPGRLEKLHKAGQKKLSRTDPESRFLRERGGFTLGYTGEVAVSDDHLIVAQRVTQNATDNGSLVGMVEEVEKQCGARPEIVSADAGFFSVENLEELEARGIDGYVPDSHLAKELNGRGRTRGVGSSYRLHHAANRRMRQKLRSPSGLRIYRRRKELVEPVFGVLKEQRGMRRFRRRGLAAVGVEFTLAAVAFNLTRMFATGQRLA